jgi:galactokinase
MNPEMGKVKVRFENLFGKRSLIIRSPGRVNLIGEHTDYNEGFVLPAAIEKSIYFAVHPRNDKKCCLHAADLNESTEFEISNLCKSEKSWANYLIGVLEQIKNLGKEFRGFECVFGGDIPIGAGLSSSAAIEAGVAFALNNMYELGIDDIDLVKLSQRAENEFVGVKCGIMDQFINIFGKVNKVLKLDCRSLEYEYFPFENKELRIVLCDTKVKHSLAGSEYNVRRKQCEEGVIKLKRFDSSIKSLRDVNLDFLYEHKDDMAPLIFKRCEYVIKENERVELSCIDLNSSNFTGFGEMMYQSHEGLKNGYEVSCSELDLLVDIASQHDGVVGARMMGGGFGGCTINLVYEDRIENFKEVVSSRYRQKYLVDPEFYISEIVGGTEIVS